MCRKLLVLALIALAVPCRAVGIQGRWGLSAPIVSGRNDPSYALIYAHSDRTVWAFDLALRFRDQLTDNRSTQFPLSATGDAFAVSGGPRLRSYRRPEADLSFYLDRFLRGAYSSAENRPLSGSSLTFRQWSVAGGIGVGCEYFVTRFHFGIAAHSDVASLRYVEDSIRGGTSVFGGGESAMSSAAEFDFSLRPALVLRAYF